MQEEDLVQQLMIAEDRSAMSIFMAYSDDRFEAAFNMDVWLKSGFIPKHIKEYCREELRKLRNAQKIRAPHHHVPPPYSPFENGLAGRFRARLRMGCWSRMAVVEARDVDPREPWPDGRDRPQDQALSDGPDR
jgi:hypothetical protein